LRILKKRITKKESDRIQDITKAQEKVRNLHTYYKGECKKKIINTSEAEEYYMTVEDFIDVIGLSKSNYKIICEKINKATKHFYLELSSSELKYLLKLIYTLHLWGFSFQQITYIISTKLSKNTIQSYVGISSIIYGKKDYILRQKPICVYFSDDNTKFLFIDYENNPLYAQDLKSESTQNIKSLQVKQYSPIEIRKFKSSRIYQKVSKNYGWVRD
jgi:hypothetical protein